MTLVATLIQEGGTIKVKCWRCGKGKKTFQAHDLVKLAKPGEWINEFVIRCKCTYCGAQSPTFEVPIKPISRSWGRDP